MQYGKTKQGKKERKQRLSEDGSKDICAARKWAFMTPLFQQQTGRTSFL